VGKWDSGAGGQLGGGMERQRGRHSDRTGGGGVSEAVRRQGSDSGARSVTLGQRDSLSGLVKQ
jgi:hypothetical protein